VKTKDDVKEVKMEKMKKDIEMDTLLAQQLE